MPAAPCTGLAASGVCSGRPARGLPHSRGRSALSHPSRPALLGQSVQDVARLENKQLLLLLLLLFLEVRRRPPYSQCPYQ
eukprot:1849669-Heterocapsa_arctica.AAC.1